MKYNHIVLIKNTANILFKNKKEIKLFLFHLTVVTTSHLVHDAEIERYSYVINNLKTSTLNKSFAKLFWV